MGVWSSTSSLAKKISKQEGKREDFASVVSTMSFDVVRFSQMQTARLSHHSPFQLAGRFNPFYKSPESAFNPGWAI